MNKSYSEQVLNLMNSKPKGTIFLYSDFSHIGKRDTLRKTLKRLVDSKEVTRVFSGMFSILEYSDILNKEIYPSPVKIAENIARNFMWDIYPSGNTALNIVGLSTQVTNVYEYLSDGPYRKYNYMGHEISFKNTVNKKLRLKSNELVYLVTAIDHLGNDNIKEKEKEVISNYIRKYNVDEYIPKGIKQLPEWIYLLLNEIVEGY